MMNWSYSYKNLRIWFKGIEESNIYQIIEAAT